MSGLDPYAIVKKPIVSEKSYKLMDENVYCFEVSKDATKVDVRYAVEALFNVSVVSVNTLNRKGKRKRNRKNGTWVTGASKKHALVRLAEGDSIELFEK